MKNNENNPDESTEKNYDRERDYKAWETAEIIRDLTLGNPPRYAADTKEKKAKVKRLQVEIDEAKRKGYVIFTPD